MSLVPGQEELIAKLSRYTETPIDILCDFCNEQYSMSYKQYLHLKSEKYCCPNCLKSRVKKYDENGELYFAYAPYRNKDWLRQEYIVKGREASEIARECGVNLRSIREWIAKFGLTTKKEKISKLPASDIVDMYVNQKMTSIEIGHIFSVSDQTIIKLLRQNGVRIPTRSELSTAYMQEKGGRARAIARGRDMAEKIKTSCRLRGVDIKKFDGFVTTEQHRVRGSAEYDDWRTSVFQRDKYTCQKCLRRGGIRLNAHHIENFSEHENLRFDLNNGVTLCEECHLIQYPNSFHALYGEKHNNAEQIEEFLGRQINNRS